MDISGYTPTYNILKFTIIPEPTTLLLLAVGSLSGKVSDLPGVVIYIAAYRKLAGGNFENT